MASPEKQLQSLYEEFQKFQQELQTTVDALQKLEAQQQESENVQKEFKTLTPTSKVYKLVGPVLLKQDKDEASTAVMERLQFIQEAINRTKSEIDKIKNKCQRKQMEISELQSQAQAQMQGQQAGGAGSGPPGAGQQAQVAS
ncbi:MAG: actin-like protein arp8 [Chaenotheca gracillima]|nr:MAG: actin-like protein arp8 [Chaenotheca gracillima]